MELTRRINSLMSHHFAVLRGAFESSEAFKRSTLRVELSDLNSHCFKHNFLCSSPSCLCQTGIENNQHFLLHCPRFTVQRRILLDLVSKSVDVDIISSFSKELCNLLLYVYPTACVLNNCMIIEATLQNIKSTGRFQMASALITTGDITFIS